MDRFQRTLRSKAVFSGTGLHSGRTVSVEVLPANAGSGIVFERIDLPSMPKIKASPANVRSTELSTTICDGSTSVSTVEHLMAAFAGLGIDNALVRLDAAEVPIMDGSARPFVEGLRRAGSAKCQGFKRHYVVKKAFEVRDGDRMMRIEPAPQLSFHCVVEYRSSCIGRQSFDFNFDRLSFFELCDARTFCHVRDVDAMRAVGLALGGSLANAVVVTDTEVMNEEGLRHADEPVRHKILDCIGDLHLLGATLVGRVTLVKNGHALHVQFMRQLLEHRDDLFSVVEGADFREKSPLNADRLRARVASMPIRD